MRKKHIIVLSVWLMGMGILFKPVLFSVFQEVPGDLADARFNLYILEHGYRSLVLQERPFWDLPIFFPVQNVTAYSDILLGSAPLYWLWRALHFSPYHAYQAWLALVCSLNFWICYAWLRNVMHRKEIGAGFGAFLFAFASQRLVQIGHPQLYPQFFSILALWGLQRACQETQQKRVRIWLAIFFAATVLQIYAGFYLGWFLVVGLLAAGGIAFWNPANRVCTKNFLHAHWLWILCLSVVSFSALFPFLLHSLQALSVTGKKAFDITAPMLPRLASWLYMGKASLFYEWMHAVWPWKNIVATGYWHEHAIGIGFVTTAGVLAGALASHHHQPEKLLYKAALLIAVCVTLFPGGLTLWSFLFSVIPGASGVRAVSRIALLLLIPAAVALAHFFDDKKRTFWHIVLFGSLVLLEQIHTVHSYSITEAEKGVARVVSHIPHDCQVFYYAPRMLHPNAPAFDAYSTWTLQMDAVWAGLVLNKPTINGHSGNFPPGWLDHLAELGIQTPEDERRLQETLVLWQHVYRLDAAHTPCIIH